MTLRTLLVRSVMFHWRTSLAVTLGVAIATAVLAGALVVGESVRGSLREIALARLGRTDTVVSTTGFFREGIADDLRKTGIAAAAPIIAANGFITHESSRRRAGSILVYGVDERFWTFHGLPSADGVYVSPALAAELGAQSGDVLLTRVQKPSQIPIESLFGRKDDIGRTLRLEVAGVLPAERLGEFSLQPQQSEIRAVFAPLNRIQRELGVAGQVNTVLLSSAPGDGALGSTLRLEDLGVHVTTLSEPAAQASIAVETDMGVLNDAAAAAAERVAGRLGLHAMPVFTYLAAALRTAGHSVPYSLVTALDLSVLESSAAGPTGAPARADSIVLNTWAARELAAAPGDQVELDYDLWDPSRGIETKTAAFTVSAVVPLSGLAADRRLAPEYPGITAASSLADWDPPFPIDLSRVRPSDEAYWREYRTTPKAFIAYERGRDLWRSRYGALTSVRMAIGSGSDAATQAEAVRRALLSELPSAALGVSLTPVRALAIASSAGATDFGEYFTYFSFFLVLSALLLVVLFFKLGIEQRLRQIGILRASGYPMVIIGRLILLEAGVLALAGGVLGAGLALLFAKVILYGLRTWWIGAVGTTLLRVHASPLTVVTGVAAGVTAGIVCVLVSLRPVRRMSPRSLLQAQSIDGEYRPGTGKGRWRLRLALLLALSGVAMLTAGFLIRSAQTGAFFAAGASLLASFQLAFSAWLRSRDRGTGSTRWSLARLGFRSASARPSRSVLSTGLIASAAFVIISVDAFRHGGDDLILDRHSSTGGYALMARSELPILQDFNTAQGRDALLIDGPEISRSQITRFRLRPGQDASCLNLYQPTNPTIIAPEAGFIESNRFVFTDSIEPGAAERGNPWLLLRRHFPDGAIPAIADATSLEYVLHARVGDTFPLDTGADRPVRLRFVAALRDSVLQGELVIAEESFTQLFPARQGYQFFLVADPSVRTADQASALAGVVERELADFGVDAVGTTERLAAFHRVENTYLSTFQALGGLGLILGTLGLGTVMFRNVLERRRELALLRAVGYGRRSISALILLELALLLGAGLGAGALCAALAVAPAWLNRGGAVPGYHLLVLLGAVAAAGLLSSLVATRTAISGRLIEALRAE